MIRIRKIDIDQCGRDDGEPPLWAKITARVNGVEVRVALNERQSAALTAAAESLVMEQIREVTSARLAIVKEPAA